MIFWLIFVLHTTMCAARYDESYDYWQYVSPDVISKALGSDAASINKEELRNPETWRQILEEENKKTWMSVLDAEEMIEGDVRDFYEKVKGEIRAPWCCDFDDIKNLPDQLFHYASDEAKSFMRIVLYLMLGDVKWNNLSCFRSLVSLASLEKTLRGILKDYLDFGPYLRFVFGDNLHPYLLQRLLAFRERKFLFVLPNNWCNAGNHTNFMCQKRGFEGSFITGLYFINNAHQSMLWMDACGEDLHQKFVDNVLDMVGKHWDSDGLLRLVLCDHFLALHNTSNFLSPRGVFQDHRSKIVCGCMPPEQKEHLPRIACDFRHPETVYMVKEILHLQHNKAPDPMMSWFFSPSKEEMQFLLSTQMQPRTQYSLNKEQHAIVTAHLVSYIHDLCANMPLVCVCNRQADIIKLLKESWGVQEKITGCYESYKIFQLKIIERIFALEREEGTDKPEEIDQREALVMQYIKDGSDEERKQPLLFVVDQTAYRSGDGYGEDRIRMGIPTQEIITKMPLRDRRLFLAKCVKVRSIYTCDWGYYSPEELPYEAAFFIEMEDYLKEKQSATRN